MDDITLGFALCGSFCTYARVIPELRLLKEKYENIIPIMSEFSFLTDTRFGKAEEIVSEIEEICKNKVIKSIDEAEPIGPNGLLDALVVAPCTGNTIAKLATGIADTTVTMACKSHLRNSRPVILAVSTNDGLGGNAKNIGHLLERRNIYFVPFYQDDPMKKPTSLVADMSLIGKTAKLALKGLQVQPIILQKKLT